MKKPVLSAVGSVISLLTVGCSAEPSSPASEVPSPAAEPADEVIDFPRQTLVFQPSRDDMTAGRVVFSLYCAKPDEVRVNGVRPDPAWQDVRLSPTGEFIVDLRLQKPTDSAWLYIHLANSGKNQFDFGPLRIELPRAEDRGLVCMSVKAWFNEVTNQFDSMFYHNVDDRYALVSYCTQPPEPSPVRGRFSQNRVATVKEFQEALARPLVIKLNQRPLRKEWSK